MPLPGIVSGKAARVHGAVSCDQGALLEPGRLRDGHMPLPWRTTARDGAKGR